jgi:agmatinase
LNAPDVLLDSLEFDEDVLVDEVFPDEFDLEETHRRIRENTEDLLEYGKPVLSVGGDHSVSYPVISALKERFPEMQLVWLDAHLDLKEKVDGHVSHDVVVRELLDESFSEDEIWFVGITEIDHDEKEFLEEHPGLRVFEADELEEFLREFKSDEHPLYLSVDIDALEGLDGTGYPDGKLGMDQVKEVIESVQPVSADLVEVAPSLDFDRKTVSAGSDLVRHLATNLKQRQET